MVLKSLICLTRSMRTYKLARFQKADSFIICYRVYTGVPNLMHLGSSEGSMNIEIGRA